MISIDSDYRPSIMVILLLMTSSSGTFSSGDFNLANCVIFSLQRVRTRSTHGSAVVDRIPGTGSRTGRMYGKGLLGRR
jgi:dUTPase